MCWQDWEEKACKHKVCSQSEEAKEGSGAVAGQSRWEGIPEPHLGMRKSPPKTHGHISRVIFRLTLFNSNYS